VFTSHRQAGSFMEPAQHTKIQRIVAFRTIADAPTRRHAHGAMRSRQDGCTAQVIVINRAA